ncbi:MAG: energy transducer TonB, partial [Bacteroidota bacterium]
MNRKLSAAISTWICLLVFFPSWGMAQDEPGINDFVFVEKEPVPLNLKEVRETIGFPEAAADLGVEGNVIARILVDENGNYVKHKFIGKAESLLRDAVSQHIQELSFEPALSEGKPLKFWMNVPFAFRLLTENDLVEKAISLLDAEVAQDSGNYMVYLKRGLQFKELSRVDAAIADFNTCLKLYDETYQ